MGRVPWAPHALRDDVGWLSLYQGNRGGKRTNKVLSEHIANDAIKNNPCHVLVAQDVDENTCNLVETRSNPERPTSCSCTRERWVCLTRRKFFKLGVYLLSCRDCGKTDVARGSWQGGGEDYCDCCSHDVR